MALPVAVLLVLAPAFGASTDVPPKCFDFATTVVEPLHPPLEIVPGRDNSVFGTHPNGVDWAATRARMGMPLGELYAKLKDHRNHKDMRRTAITTTDVERPGYLDFQRVDIVVSIRALFFKAKIAWTEEWGFALLEGTAEAPRRILASYQKVAGTGHLRHQCGSYVLQAGDDGTSDLSMYDEVIADRRDAEDTRNMQAGILRSLRGRSP